MKRILFAIVACLLLSCSPDESKESIVSCYSEQEPSVDWSKTSIEQGIAGQVWFWKGNFMPVSWGEICKQQRSVYIYELTTMEEADKIEYTSFFSNVHTQLIEKVETDADGFFQLTLAPGTYSLFLEEPKGLYATYYSSIGINPVEVAVDSVTQLELNITYEAVF